MSVSPPCYPSCADIVLGMEERDIIISAFAGGGKMSCKKEVAKFKEPPHLITVPGGTSSGFRKTALSYRKNNTILDNLFRDKAKNIKPRRVAMITFADGWSWSTEVLRAKLDIPRIDTIIVMDGIHTRSLNGWYNFAKLAAFGKPRLFMAHTQIKPSCVSAKATNTNIIDSVFPKIKGRLNVPRYIWDAALEKPISVYSKSEHPKTKMYQKDPLHTLEVVGNVVRVEYEGSKAQDHTYNAQYVQPRFWEWLRNLWDDPESGVRFG